MSILNCRKAQASVEYFIILGFATFVIISVILVAYFYSGAIKDRVILNEIETSIGKVTNAAESVYYAGEPSRTTITISIPAQVQSINITNKEIYVVVSTTSGLTKRSYFSKVNLEGSINPSEGIKKIKLEAIQNKVLVD